MIGFYILKMSNYIRFMNFLKVVFVLKMKELCFIFYLYWNEKKKYLIFNYCEY